MNRDWAPNYLARWLFNQRKVWITADGRCLHIKSMEPTHVLNTLLMLERCIEPVESVVGPLHETPLYEALYKRVTKLVSA